MEDGAHHRAVWLTCRQSASIKDDEAFVRIDQAGGSEPPSFYVSASLVRPVPQPDEAAGEVRVTLIFRNNGNSVVDIPGEPLSIGPRIEVPSRLLVEG